MINTISLAKFKCAYLMSHDRLVRNGKINGSKTIKIKSWNKYATKHSTCTYFDKRLGVGSSSWNDGLDKQTKNQLIQFQDVNFIEFELSALFRTLNLNLIWK